MPRRVLHDQYFRKAKAEGYLARSAYKLIELVERKRLIRPGDRVLDLGCSPGAWMQVALEACGPAGSVVGLDLKPVEAALGDRAVALTGDVYSVTAGELVGPSGRRFDVVLSDIAPNTTGAGDDYVSERLCRRVLDLAPGVLRPGGRLAMKVFEGELYPALLRDTAAVFETARGFKPRASREVSREMYIVAEGYRPA